MSYHLAIDIGASSGRHILGSVQDGRLILEEVYRFENSPVKKDGVLAWDLEALTEEVIAGLCRCRKLGKLPATVAIDTWGVDYVLLDREGRELLPAYAYRDAASASAVAKVEALIPPRKLYERTGIQKQPFNTIYQLWRDKESGRLKDAACFLMLPEYLAWRLTGLMGCEYTDATTTGLLNAASRDWDYELLDLLGYDRALFKKLRMPSELLGPFSREIEKRAGFSARVLLCPTHDTASAVAAIPLEGDTMYISSGTWSLAGVELSAPVTTDAAFRGNYTNEGSVDGHFRFLKNIMGMWPIQSIRRETGKKYSYDQLAAMAEQSGFSGTFPADSPELSAPESMCEAIRGLLGRPELSLADMVSSVYHSLARSYSRTADELEELTGQKINAIQIVGGGGAAQYLNRLTARESGRRVLAGLSEATAAGNILSQLRYENPALSWTDCRELVRRSFPIREV